MEMWFSELHTSNVKLSMRIEKQLFSGNSDCQRIDVLESVEFGKFLALDGDILFSEKDEFIYDEMVTHVPMAVHPDVRHVLIIGGGDGGVAKELTQYDSIEKIDVVEPDEMLVEVCREHFPELACGLDDPRVNVYYQDGLRFLRNKTEEYDLIIHIHTRIIQTTCKLRTFFSVVFKIGTFCEKQCMARNGLACIRAGSVVHEFSYPFRRAFPASDFYH